MATGIATTSNFTADSVLHVGVVVESTIGSADPNMVIYTCTIPGSATHMPDGREIRFRGGVFGTSDPEVIKFLDGLARSPAAPVYRQAQDDLIRHQLAGAAEGAAIPAAQVTNESPKLSATPSTGMAAATDAALKPVTAAQAAASK